MATTSCAAAARSGEWQAIVKTERVWAGLALLIPIVALFGLALISDRSFAFRDAAHFYYPLFEWCAREWGAGRVPLWNPQENIGAPVLADASSSVFYPGKLVFALPVSFALRFKLYAVGHVLLAAAGSYCLARTWQASRTAAAVAALAFSCGGGVVFQYSNIVFLVGAAWLPFAALATDKLLRGREWRYGLLLGVCLAMMILGGDPQAAYHTLLASGLYAVLLCLNPDSTAAKPSLGKSLWRDRLVRLGVSAALLGAAAIVASLLSAVQVLPSAEATKLSNRATFNRPRTIYEAAHVLSQSANAPQPFGETRLQAAANGLFSAPQRGTHHDLAYDFSIGPWRLAEYLWPNVGGRMFPTHRRWFSLIPAEGRTWTPTLYLGLLPAVLSLASLRLRRGTARERWLSLLVILGTLGTFGGYGFGWLLHEIYAAAGWNEARLGLGKPVGGLYWLMVTLLPNYVYFRYPAKLLPLVALGLSQLAAIGWDRAFAERRPRLLWALQILAATSGVAAFIVWCLGERVFAGCRSVDPWFGPFDAAGAYHDLLGAFLQTAIVAGGSVWLLQRAWQEPAKRSQRQTLALLLTAVEIAIAHYWLVPTAPASLWRNESVVARAIARESDAASFPPRVYRGSRGGWRPASFARRGSRERIAEIAQWEHDTLFPKHQLLSRPLALSESYGSIKLADYESFWFVARQNGPHPPGETALPQSDALLLTGVEWLVLPQASAPPFAKLLTADGAAWPENCTVWQMSDATPRAWIVHEVERLPLLADPLRTASIDERTRDVLAGKPRDFRRMAVVEAEAQCVPEPGKSAALLQLAEICTIIHYEPNCVAVQAKLAQPGLLVLSDAYYPGWHAMVRPQQQTGGAAKSVEVPIVRTNRILRGAFLPAGEHVVEFRYQPRSVAIGGVLSGCSWLALAVVGLALVVRRLRQGNLRRQIE